MVRSHRRPHPQETQYHLNHLHPILRDIWATLPWSVNFGALWESLLPVDQAISLEKMNVEMIILEAHLR